MNFVTCLIQCLANDELLAQFNRLTGRKLGQRGPKSSLEAAIDITTGYDAVRSYDDQQDMAAFAEFVHDAVWMRIADQTTADTQRGDG